MSTSRRVVLLCATAGGFGRLAADLGGTQVEGSSLDAAWRQGFRAARKFPHRYGETWLYFLRPKVAWNECYRGVQWACWWLGWTNPVYKKRGW